jgi:hypothetical protein
MAHEIHLEKVRPGIAPGGIWVRICAPDELLVERALDSIAECGRYAEEDAQRTIDYFERRDIRGEVRAYFYDGDSGKCMCTLVTDRR